MCGALAAAVWALGQPLDKALFGSAYDDVELLGRALTRGEHWYVRGLALHLFNGALFGAAYTNVAPAMPLPPALRGPAAALGEHVALWPLAAVSDRLHPARDQLPTLSGNRRAYAQAAWRHLLFGALLGELERRLNDHREEQVLDREPGYSSNGRGSLEDTITAGPAS